MKLIVALGNPGVKYANTRHNAGVLFLDFLISKAEIKNPAQNAFKGQFLKTKLFGKEVGLLFPQTFMNLSGQSVLLASKFFKIDPSDIIVLQDDKDLMLGKVKVSFDSGAAGHNGIKSISETLGTQKYHRIRIGVESRTSNDQTPTDAFVLGVFSEEEKKVLVESFGTAEGLLRVLVEK